MDPRHQVKTKVDGPFPFIPRGLSRTYAAFYIGVGTTLFDEMVADGRMPKPKRVNSRTIWDRFEIDGAFTDLSTDEDTLDALLARSAKTKSSWDE
jgi:hypothetical protein